MKTSVMTQRKMRVCHLLDILLSGAVILYVIYIIRNFDGSKGLFSGLFFLLAVVNANRLAEGKYPKIQGFCVMAFYLIGAGLILLLDSFHSSLLAAVIVEFVVILFNQIMVILKKPKKRVIALNVISILMIVIMAAFVFGSDMQMNDLAEMEKAAFDGNPEYAIIQEGIDQVENAGNIYSFTIQDMFLSFYLMIIIFCQIALHVVSISVSHMKLRILMNIVRETYVLEILLGLLLMIIICSVIFSTLEESMSRYGDALWYCFALVTTIGFGDITANTTLGRILSILLGIYGIVVVAIITSVVVNFYGEVRRMTDHKSDTEKELPDEDE